MATSGSEHPFSGATDQTLSRGIGEGQLGGTNSGSGTGISQTLRDTTYKKLDDQKARASETLGSIAGAVRGMTQPLRDGGQAGVADYVTRAADSMERWASQMQQQDIDDAIRAVQQFARRQPAVFFGAAFGLGLLAARFMKSSPGRGEDMRGRFGGGPDMGGQFGGTRYGARDIATPVDIPRVSSDVRPAGEVL